MDFDFEFAREKDKKMYKFKFYKCKQSKPIFCVSASVKSKLYKNNYLKKTYNSTHIKPNKYLRIICFIKFLFEIY